jgi:predicted nuclease of restriction endonuclease-like (RecB) superfamily
MTSHFTANNDYTCWLGEVKKRIRSARLSAARSVNCELILLYWDIGQGIIEKQKTLGWGKSVVQNLAKDLQLEFPGMRGFSADNLWRMRQFYSEYSTDKFLSHAETEVRRFEVVEFLEQAVPEVRGKIRGGDLEQAVPDLAMTVRQLLAMVPWGHHVEIMKKVSEPAARLYYLHATAQCAWTRKVLLNQIKAGAYERNLAQDKAHNFPEVLPKHLVEQAEETLKSSYNLEFLGISREIHERELEDRLIEQLKDFVLELGYGFCFIGRQYRLLLGRKEYFIDLLFYHRFLKCLVAIDLKIGEFEPEYAGKMDFYLNVLNDTERGTDDNPSIGIILCAEKDDLEVEFALKSKTNPIGVAEYQLKTTLPKALRGKLPSPQDLSRALGLSPKRPRR